MKKYNVNSYSKYREDLEITIKRIPNKKWNDYTRDELVTVFMPLVENLARRFSTSPSASGVMTIPDMIQEGGVGLIKAVDRIEWKTIYEAEKPERRLKSFLAKRIKGAIRRGIDNNRGSMRIPEHKLNEIRKDFEANKDSVEIFFNSIFTSIDAIENKDAILQIADEEKNNSNAAQNAFLLKLLNTHLNQREKDVIRMSFGLDCEKRSATEIANHLNIQGSSSYVRVSQLKKQAIDKLKKNVDRSQALDFL